MMKQSHINYIKNLGATDTELKEFEAAYNSDAAYYERIIDNNIETPESEFSVVAEDMFDLAGSALKFDDPKRYESLKKQSTEAVFDAFVHDYDPEIDENLTKLQNAEQFIGTFDDCEIINFKCSGRYLLLRTI